MKFNSFLKTSVSVAMGTPFLHLGQMGPQKNNKVSLIYSVAGFAAEFSCSPVCACSSQLCQSVGVHYCTYMFVYFKVVCIYVCLGVEPRSRSGVLLSRSPLYLFKYSYYILFVYFVCLSACAHQPVILLPSLLPYFLTWFH